MTEVQDICERLGKWGCLIFCYLRAINVDTTEAILHFDALVARGIITDECYVNDGNALIKYFGAEKRVAFVDETQIGKDVLYITKYYNERTGHYHFVITGGKDKVVFDSLTNSTTVKEGVPIQWRRLV